MIANRVFVAALLLLTACESEEEDAFDRNRAKWDSAKPDSYVIEVCSTGFTQGVCVQSAVSDGEVVAARSRAPGQDWVELEPESVAEPVTELFDEAEGLECDDLSVAFDGTYGFVRSYDCTAGTETVGKVVECFAPDTTDFAACPDET